MMYSRGPSYIGLGGGWSETVPVTCAYCKSQAFERVSNCENCGGPLKWPEQVEEVVRREYRITRDQYETTNFGDSAKNYVVGVPDERITETVIRKRRE